MHEIKNIIILSTFKHLYQSIKKQSLIYKKIRTTLIKQFFIKKEGILEFPQNCFNSSDSFIFFNSYYIIDYKSMHKSELKYSSTDSFVELQDLPDQIIYNLQSFSLKFIHSFSDLPQISQHLSTGITCNQDKFSTQMENIAFGQSNPTVQFEQINIKIDQDGSTSVNTGQLTIVEQPITQISTRKGCNCKKTGCLKMYCQCFSSGKICTKQCNCCNCCNHEESTEIIKKAKQVIRQRSGKSSYDAVDNSYKKRCTCRKSQCQKKYCECFNAGQSCNQNCKCEDCLNGTHSQQYHSKRNLQKNIMV